MMVLPRVIHPEGIAEISRGSSEAKTPGMQSHESTDPEGVAHSASSATLSGSNRTLANISGGAPFGDPRLPSATPPASIARTSGCKGGSR